MSRFFFTVVFLLSVMLVRAQSLQEASSYFVGHSLVNFDMPYIFHCLAQSAGKENTYDSQIINGASIWSNYDNYRSAQGLPYTEALPTGDYSHMIVTEAIPLLNHTTWSQTYVYADSFLTYARTYRPDIRYYIYETWHCINTGIGGCYDETGVQLPWQPRLLDDFPKWAKIVDSVRILQNYNDVYMVPAGQAFYRLSQQIDLGNVPGITSFRELFSDDIHLTLTGNYFVACVMYATIYGESPEGLTNIIYDQYNNLILTVPEEVADIIQAVAWQEVCENPYSGVNGVITSMENSSESLLSMNVYPQPATSEFTVELPGEQPAGFMLSNSMGKVVLQGAMNGRRTIIDAGNLSPGMYMLTVSQGREVFTKKVSIR